MKLSELAKDLEIREKRHFADVDITAISSDSRKVEEGSLFVAIKGYTVDGHDFTRAAVESGASAIVSERPVEHPVPVIVVSDSAKAGAHMARRFYGDPASGIFLAGITGTNGKTSTAFFLRSILETGMGASGIIGTIGFGSSNDILPTANTTPDSLELFSILAGFVAGGCSSAVMEVSSHAAVQGRISEIEFDAGIFTNITRDHLDFHGTLEKYMAAKETLAESLVSPGRKKPPGLLVYNTDDRYVNEIGERFQGRKISFGFSRGAGVRAESLLADISGTRFSLVTDRERIGIKLNLHGRFSAYNALGAAAAALEAGISVEQIKEGLEKILKVPGRFQVIRREGLPTVVIDYAHTPDALENLLGFCRELGNEKVITVFGCGGDRDRGKRPMMGAVAARLSDRVFITSDNPRSEDPEKIINDILEGIKDRSAAIEVEIDRAIAIKKAIGGSSAGDLVVIAGKGHEDYQVLGTGKIDFSDSGEAEKALSEMEDGYQN
ncbi:MAG: UDP-N-acetylmuramoyl-L-alanyl-D-glutamate--2,6-diaminopimelate ligase [Candidatus Krumholzibacteriota bacterium]|nr:UDP-N-acetylmuramoyl-L-alanyl-D-glutamate--2,6-diaminopimelate ligase [Candidatus Krumholzibacteriota bacterium]